MVTFVVESDQVSVPEWVTDLAAFRRWADSPDFPETGRVCYLPGEVWIDMSKEQTFTHLAVKNEFNIVLGPLVKAGQLGLYLPDGARLSNVDADFAVVPDAVFVSAAGLRDRVRLLEGRDEGYVELEGTPDLVLEVVSRSSVRKDRQVLRKACWEAGIPEYWLVDARPEPLVFDILRHGPRGYRAPAKAKGWVRSAAFGKWFRLSRRLNALEHPEYTLEAR
jgi:Uma2 family endonuclease